MAYRIDRNRDAAFLKEEELDLLTYHKFEPGDRVVVCGGCGHVHLESSWQANGSLCPNCNASQQRTVASLNELAQVKALPKKGRAVQTDRTRYRSFRRLDANTAQADPASEPTRRTVSAGSPSTGAEGRTAAGTTSGSASRRSTETSTGRRRRRRLPFRLLITALILFLLYNPVKNLITEHFFAKTEAEGEEEAWDAAAENEMTDWVVADPYACIVTAPQCNVCTTPEVAEGNVAAQLSRGTSVNWDETWLNEETGTTWLHVTALDGSGTSGWVSGKVLNFLYDTEIMPQQMETPMAWAEAGEGKNAPANLLDSYCLSSWYAESAGPGTEIRLSYEEAVVRGILLTNGDASSREAYEGSNRICEVEFVFDNGESYQATLADEYGYCGRLYTVRTDTPSTSVTIRVISVYEGEDPHLAISGINLYETDLNRYPSGNWEA